MPSSAEPAIPLFPTPGVDALRSYSAAAAWNAQVRNVPLPEADIRATTLADARTGLFNVSRAPSWVMDAMQAGKTRHSGIATPALTIFAVRDTPRDLHPRDAATRAANAALSELWNARTDRRERAMKRDVPGVRVVRIPRAEHAVFLSNPDAVLDAIRVFVTENATR